MSTITIDPNTGLLLRDGHKIKVPRDADHKPAALMLGVDPDGNFVPLRTDEFGNLLVKLV